MEDQNKHIDDLFREELGNYTETPPPAVWEALEQRLDNHQRRRMPMWWWYVLLVVVVTAGGIVAKMAMTHNGKGNNGVVKDTAVLHPGNDVGGPVIHTDGLDSDTAAKEQKGIKQPNSKVNPQLRKVASRQTRPIRGTIARRGTLQKKENNIAGTVVRKRRHHDSPTITSNTAAKNIAADTAANIDSATQLPATSSTNYIMHSRHKISGNDVTENTNHHKRPAKKNNVVDNSGGNVTRHRQPTVDAARQANDTIGNTSQLTGIVSNKKGNNTTRSGHQRADNTGMKPAAVATHAPLKNRSKAGQSGTTKDHPKGVAKRGVITGDTVSAAKPIDVKGDTASAKTVVVNPAKRKKHGIITNNAVSAAKPIDVKGDTASAKTVVVNPVKGKRHGTKTNSAASSAKPIDVKGDTVSAKKVVMNPAKGKKPNIQPKNGKTANGKPIVVKGDTATGRHIVVNAAKSKKRHTEPATRILNTGKPIVVTAVKSTTAKPIIPRAAKDAAPSKVVVTATNATNNPLQQLAATASNKNAVTAPAPVGAPAPTITGTFKPTEQKPAATPDVLHDFLKIDPTDPNSGGSSDGGAGADASAGDGSAPATAQKPSKPRRWSAGVKAGYETGFADYKASKYLVSPFLQYSLSKTVSLLLQPGIKQAHVNNNVITPPSYYFQYNDPAPTLVSQTVIDTFGNDSVRRSFVYNGTYDSFRISHTIDQTYLEMELPILMQVKLAKGLSFTGGFTIQYSKLLNIRTDSFSTTVNVAPYTITYPLSSPNSPVPTPPDISTIFPHTAQPYSNYSATSYQNAPYNPLRFGYAIGFSYSLWDKLLFDVMLQQNLSNISYLTNQSVSKIYSQPYIRFTVGYKFLRGSY